ncbi:glycosyltransferase family A protein, partial [Pseudoalteromonas sp. SIMBA_153]
MPLYNSERYVEDSINSVISQTFRDWELILIDDASTDST